MSDKTTMDYDDIEDAFPEGVIIVRREMEYDAQDAIRIARAKNDGLDPTMDDILDVVYEWARIDFGCSQRGNPEMRFININEEDIEGLY